jgi:ATP synthase protein I
MNELPGYEDRTKRLIQEVDERVARKLRARSSRRQSLWAGLRMSGLIGWSVVLPVLLGVAAVVWIDARWPSRFSWTVTLLFLGLAAGCYGAWSWIERERRRIRPPDKEERRE